MTRTEAGRAGRLERTLPGGRAVAVGVTVCVHLGTSGLSPRHSCGDILICVPALPSLPATVHTYDFMECSLHYVLLSHLGVAPKDGEEGKSSQGQSVE